MGEGFEVPHERIFLKFLPAFPVRRYFYAIMPASVLLPLPRLVLAFAMGIVLWIYAWKPLPVLVFVLLYGLGVAGLLCLRGSGRHVRKHAEGLIIVLFLVTAGYHLGQQRDQLLRDDHFSRSAGLPGFLVLRVSEPVSEKTNSFQAICRVEAIVTESGSNPLSGKIIVYLEKDSLAVRLSYGDIILLENRYDAVSPPRNPGQFDFRRFLKLRNIHHSTYRASGDWYLTGDNRGFRLIRLSLDMRERALEIFARSGLADRDLAVLSALFLGYREYLTEDLQREFAGAGAMHILCVSGLHVGILFLVLKSLFSFLGRKAFGNILRTCLVLVFIWFYAAITGFSPSVLRSATMFSFVLFGQGFQRRTHIYNTLSTSALLLLFMDPYMISRIGFQLSYLAVLSIVTLQPHMYALLRSENFLLRKSWALITVSIAAQLATGPLALYYFNQFPNFFLLTNLLAIPLATLVIYSAILCLACAVWAPASAVSGAVLSVILSALNGVVQFVEGLPYSTWSDAYISLPQTLLVFVVLFNGACYFLLKKREAVLWALSGIMILSASAGLRQVQNHRQAAFVVYDVNRAFLADFFSTDGLISLGCRSGADPDPAGRQAAPFRIRMGKRENTTLVMGEDMRHRGGAFFMEGPLILYEDLHVLLVNSENPPHLPGLKVDYLLVTGNRAADPQTWLREIAPLKVIVSSASTNWQTRRWAEACEASGTACWVVRERGAYLRRF
jgi:competence protein ComEC